MKKDTVVSIEEKLGYLASIVIEADISESSHKEPETRIRVSLTVGAEERVVSFNTDRHNLENLRNSLNEILDEIPVPRTLPF